MLLLLLFFVRVQQRVGVRVCFIRCAVLCLWKPLVVDEVYVFLTGYVGFASHHRSLSVQRWMKYVCVYQCMWALVQV